MSGFSSTLPGMTEVSNLASNAVWDFFAGALNLELTVLPGDRQITVWNLASSELIMILNITGNSSSISTVNRQFTNIPCELAVYAQGRFQVLTVSNISATSCVSGSGALARIETRFPNAIVSTSQSDLTIQAGSIRSFEAASAPGIEYLWWIQQMNLVGSQRQFGPIQFNTPGVFTVTLNVRNTEGLVDPVPKRLNINVVP
ncbi:MAG: hypothetical protein OEZ43_13625 [Gammaproteobacteria bacterium]|nr:hypothetical protein [Gammaproteobacteria bacterium]